MHFVPSRSANSGTLRMAWYRWSRTSRRCRDVVTVCVEFFRCNRHGESSFLRPGPRAGKRMPPAPRRALDAV